MPNRYWVAPATGNWNTTANWSATSGGTGGASVPGSGDAAIFNSGNADCIIDASATVDSINATGFNGNLVTQQPLTCDQLQWAGNLLSLAKSKIETLIVKRSNANGSKVCFDPHGTASLLRINPFLLAHTKKSGTNQTFQWNAFPGATSYHLQWSSNNGAWTNWGNGANTETTTNTTITGGYTGSNWKLRIRANLPGGGVTDWITISFDPTVADFTIDYSSLYPTISGPLDIETLEVETGSNAITLDNQAEVRLTGDVTIPSGLTLTQAFGAKFTLFGTQDQIVSASSGTPEFSLNKTAGNA